MQRRAARPLHWVAFLAYCVAAGVLWYESSLSGYAGSRHLQRQFLDDLPVAAWSSGPCTEALSLWAVEQVRAGVAHGLPTGLGYLRASERHLARYSALGCPSGPLLVAGRMALREANRLRRAANMMQLANIPGGLR